MKKEMVNSPAHYNQVSMECIDAIVGAYGKEEAKIFCKINAFKYLWRLGHKDEEEQEIGKTKWYLDKYVELSTRPEEDPYCELSQVGSFKLGDKVEFDYYNGISATIERKTISKIKDYDDHITIEFTDGETPVTLLCKEDVKHVFRHINN